MMFVILVPFCELKKGNKNGNVYMLISFYDRIRCAHTKKTMHFVWLFSMTVCLTKLSVPVEGFLQQRINKLQYSVLYFNLANKREILSLWLFVDEIRLFLWPL